ncbi:expressed unknown protein [Seminavis robusta]|uniref:Uncharacterized protein n=1 Tax=Seminavis robusta TaxID=568900 RepID=A0A9N8DKH4_9STRA|nr:expressed unknown protein [Seminavis robusta]|eukprot:Sro130_g061940.1 n/a (299) ;mRNA; r:59591-60487
MTSSCVQCGKENVTSSFQCTNCPSYGGETRRFYVCNRDCQKAFWRSHKKEDKASQSAGTTKASAREDVHHVETRFGSLTMRTMDKNDFVESMSNPRSWFQQLGRTQAAEWIVDCYRMRADDDVQWGSFNFHGLYEIANGAETLHDGTNDATLSKADKAFILTEDFLVFMTLAVHNEILPARLEDFDFTACIGRFAPALLPEPFNKQAAKAKWGGENVFSTRPSLRRTAERVYGLSSMYSYNDDDAQKQGERTQQEIKNSIRSGLVRNNFEASSSNLFNKLGGKQLWFGLYQRLRRADM